ncbi:Alpha/Beta hydrolase protein [Pavlovales sp. CCMP2436]|nr:Alpha/Beta hydrolase protein [Pavlovales sp. CCMP2436]
MGSAEVSDQEDGVVHVIARGLADASRVSVIGWSYGGYLALLCLARAPEVFHAAVAGAPVTHWDGYDTHYTERFMGRYELLLFPNERHTPRRHSDRVYMEQRIIEFFQAALSG